MELDKDEPDSFADILKWTDTGKIVPLAGLTPEDGEPLILQLLHTYLLARKLCLEELENQIMDAMRDWHLRWPARPQELQILEDGAYLDCCMSNYLVQQLSYDILQHHSLQADKSVQTFLMAGRRGRPVVSFWRRSTLQTKRTPTTQPSRSDATGTVTSGFDHATKTAERRGG